MDVHSDRRRRDSLLFATTFIDECLALVGPTTYTGHMFEDIATQDPAGFLAAVTEQLAKLPSELWRTGNEGFAEIAAAMDALAVQVDCARVGLVPEAESRGVVSESAAPSATDWLLEHCFTSSRPTPPGPWTWPGRAPCPRTRS